MKKLIIVLALCLSAFVQSFAVGEEFKVGDLYYKITSNVEPYTVEVYDGPDRASVTIPETVTNKGITYSVTSIGDWAFSQSILQSVVIPNSVTSIGERAFEYCSNLQSVVIPNSVTSIGEGAFASCELLESVVIPNSVTSIGDDAFFSCLINMMVIPNSITSIGDWGSVFIMNLFLKSETPQYPFEADCIYVPCGSIKNYRNYKYADYERMYQEGRLIEYEYLLIGISDGNSYVEITQHPTCQNNQAEIKAIPSLGYAFSQWSDGSTDNPYKLTLISDSTLSASFEYVGVSNVTLAKDDNSGVGGVTGGGSFTNGTQTVIKANSGEGYAFSHWNDGNTENPRTITVTQDTTFTAYFFEKEFFSMV